MILPKRLVALWPALTLVAVSAALGTMVGAPLRAVFIVGCLAVGLHAWRRGPEVHLQSILILFTFAPFIRRLIDLPSGYDESGLMLVGPLLALMAPAADIVTGRVVLAHALPRMLALVMVALSVLYATSITLFQGEWVKAAAAGVKWYAPLVYAAVIMVRPERERLADAAAGAFRWLLPITGLYGIYQYVDPPEWDRYWLLYANTTAGLPLPFEVRTFSMLNGPASYATFTAVGLVLVGVLRGNLLSVLLVAPALVSFLLSSYRTAWLSLAAGLLFCLLHPMTRARASGVALVMAAGVMVVLTVLPFSDAIGERLATFGEGSQDGSAQERLQEFVTLWNAPDSALWGVGLTNDSFLAAGDMPVDGMLVSCWLAMGLFVGLFCLFGFVLGAVNAVLTGWRSGSREIVAVGALALGTLVQLPLANIGSAELGFLYWFVVALGTPKPASTAGLADGLPRGLLSPTHPAL